MGTKHILYELEQEQVESIQFIRNSGFSLLSQISNRPGNILVFAPGRDADTYREAFKDTCVDVATLPFDIEKYGNTPYNAFYFLFDSEFISYSDVSDTFTFRTFEDIDTLTPFLFALNNVNVVVLGTGKLWR